MIFAVVGPSGAGKDTLIAAARVQRPELHLVRRVITRPGDAGGEDFDGVSEVEFAHKLSSGEFVLNWDAHGLRYGIPRSQVQANGITLFNGSRAGLLRARTVFPDLRVVLVTAPVPVLASRLAARGRETEADIAARLERAGFDLPPGLDLRVVNNDGTLAQGVAQFLAALHP